MLEFTESLLRSFLRSGWFVVGLVVLATLPIASMIVNFLSMALSCMAGSGMRVLFYGWVLGTLACAVHRAFQPPEKRQCEQGFLVSTLITIIPCALLIIVGQGIYSVTTWLDDMWINALGQGPGMSLGFLGMALAWCVSVRPIKNPGGAFPRNESPRAFVQGTEVVVHDYLDDRRTAEHNYVLVPHADDRKAHMRGFGLGLQRQHCIVIGTRGKATKLYQIDNIRYPKETPDKWYAQVSLLSSASCSHCGTQYAPANSCILCDKF